MTERLIVAGAGGQGIMLLGKVLAEAAARDNKEVTWFPCYGAEVRGGSAYCMVVISDEEIGSPYVDEADTLIVMNEPSLEKFKTRLKDNGVLFINSSLVPEKARAKIKALSLPFTRIAVKLGNIKVANIVALGAFLKKKKIVSLGVASKTIKEMAPEPELAQINLAALAEGMKLI